MLAEKTIILDFDSTFINCETLDILATIIYQDSKELPNIVAAISSATNAAMRGEASFHQTLITRVEMLKIEKQHIVAAIDLLKQKISTSFMRNKDFIQTHAEQIFVFSGGFAEIIIPVVAEFDIPETHIFANNFRFSGNKVVGIDETCLLAHNLGKSKQLSALKRTGDVYIIGDGATDAEIKYHHANVLFYLYKENVFRENLVGVADKIIGSLDEFIQDFYLKV